LYETDGQLIGQAQAGQARRELIRRYAGTIGRVIDDLPEPTRTVSLHAFGVFGYEELSSRNNW